MRHLLIFLATINALALSPVGAVHELLQHAEELPDGRILVLTPQRLALLDSPSAESVRASHWCSSPEFYRGLTLHDGHAFVPTKSGLQVVRVDEDALALTAEIRATYVWDRPIIADGHLYFMRSHDLQIYDIADLSDPKPVAMLNFDINGHIFTVFRGHLYLATHKGLQVYDLARPAKPRRLDVDLTIPGKRLGFMHLVDNTLHVSTDKGLTRLDVSEVTAPRIIDTNAKVPLATRVLPRPDGWLAFYHAVALRPTGERLVGEWRIVARDPDAVAAEFQKTGLFTNRKLLGGAAANDHLAIYADGKTQIFDITDPATPKRVTTVDYGGGIRSQVHGNRIFTNAGMLDLSDPANPKHQRLPGSRIAIANGSLYVVSVNQMEILSLDDMKPLRSVTLKRPPKVFAVNRDYLIESVKGGTMTIDKLGESSVEAEYLFEVQGEKERAYSLDVRDDVLYAVFGGSVRAYDIRDPSQPKRLAAFGDARRFQFLDAQDGVVFGAPSGRYSAAFDLQTASKLEEGPTIIGARFIQIFGDKLLVGMPPGGATILASPTLTRLQQNRADRAELEAKVAANPADNQAIADLALLALKHGATWKATRHIDSLANQELDEATHASIAAFKAEQTRLRELKEAAAAFERDAKESKMAYFSHDENGNIIGLRIDRQQMFRRHLDYSSTLPIASLTMGREPLEAVDLEFAANLPELHYLRLLSLPENVAPLAPLSDMRGLKTLNLNGNDLAGRELAPIAGLGEILALSLEGTDIGDDDLVHIAGLPKLRHLDLKSCVITDAGLAQLRELRNLETLNLAECRVTGAGFANFAEMSKLWSLELQETPIETGMEHIGALTQLRALDLSESKFGDDQLAHLMPLVNMENLNLEATSITSAVIAALTTMTTLRELNLAGTKIDDATLETLAKLPALERVSLRGTAITDSGLAYLAMLPKLRELDIANCAAVTDDGIAKLANSANLQRVGVQGTSMTHAGLQLLPGVKIDWQERQAPEVAAHHEAQEHIAAMPENLAFRLEANELVLTDADSGVEYARETPTDLLGDAVNLRALAAWETRCWVGSDRGILRFEPATRVWSRFAVDREHLDVPIQALAIADAVLQVSFGQNQEARFDLKERRWLPAPALVTPAPVAASPPAQGPKIKLSWIVVIAILLLLGTVTIARRARG